MTPSKYLRWITHDYFDIWLDSYGIPKTKEEKTLDLRIRQISDIKNKNRNMYVGWSASERWIEIHGVHAINSLNFGYGYLRCRGYLQETDGEKLDLLYGLMGAKHMPDWNISRIVSHRAGISVSRHPSERNRIDAGVSCLSSILSDLERSMK